MIRDAKRLMATFADMEELIRLGAYRRGSNPEVDQSIDASGPLETFLTQGKDECTRRHDGYDDLAHLLESTVGLRYPHSGE
ncbi:MAG: fliI [Proteobacteria bacterium]|nr:fliI [Pseudomonadota bacterium]